MFCENALDYNETHNNALRKKNRQDMAKQGEGWRMGKNVKISTKIMLQLTSIKVQVRVKARI